jgi:hypothetical protein
MPRTLLCPTCDQPAGRAPRGRVSVDRPFEECPHCRAVVTRPGAGEWDLLAAPRRIEWLAERLLLPVAIGGLPGLALFAWPPPDGQGWLQRPLVVLALGLGTGLLAGILRVQAPIRRSRSRMGDPMYRARLVAFERQALGTPER